VSATAKPADVLAGDARWCVVEGDALATMREMPNASVDSILMDPPYGVDIAEWDGDLPPQTWLDECSRISRGTVLWFGAAPKVLEFANYKPTPDRIMVWAPSFTMSRTAAHGIFYRWHPIVLWRPAANKGAVPFDVLRHNTHGYNEWNHNCTKPLKLMRDLVLAFSPPDGIVADFTAGSGTTGAAAIVEGRRAILCELDPRHAQTCRDRCIEAETGVDWRNPKQVWLFDDAAVKKSRRKKAEK
jgi:hypothetical protein